MQASHDLQFSLSRRNKAALLVLFSFLLPFVVMVLGLLAMHVVPFGKHNLAITDGQYYLNGLLQLCRTLRGEYGLLYSLNNGLGSNEWSQLAWGGFNPVLLLALFADIDTIPAWFTWISLTNMACCGLTMYILLAGVRGHRLDNLIFSTSYAMIGFNVVNCYQTLFFIGPQLLPLMVLGLIWIFRGRTPLLYILSLAFCCFCNFYFGFMLCVVSVVLFLARLYTGGEAYRGKRKALFLTWAVSSLAAGLLAAPMWLPALKAYSGGGRLEQTVLAEYTFRENMPFIQMFSKLFSGANSTSELIRGMPNIFCGILSVFLTILYLMNRTVPRRRKRAAAVVLVFYLLTFYIPAFTLLMHGGTHTNWFPYRYSYVFSFFLVALAAEEFIHLDSLTMSDLRRAGSVLLIAALLVFSVSYEFITGGAVLLDLLLLALMGLGFWFYKTRPDKAPRRTFSLLLILLVCGNLYANYLISINSMRIWELDLEEYRENTFEYSALIEGIKSSKDTFFRMEKDVSESGSVGADPALYGYSGVSHSGPTERMFVHKGLSKLGINWFDMRHWYEEGVPAATDSLLGLEYLIADRDLAAEKGYEKRISGMKQSIYQSHTALSLAILADGSCTEPELGNNAFENLNAVWRAMTGESRDLFIPQEEVTFTLHTDVSSKPVTSTELRESMSRTADEEESAQAESSVYIAYTFTAERDGPIYLFDTSIPDSVNGLSAPSIKLCGVYAAGDTVEGVIPINASAATESIMRGYCANLAYAYADLQVLQQYAELLNSRPITVSVEKDTLIRAAFTAAAGQRILFTIPWDEGWTCRIDGEIVPIEKTWDLFMSVSVPEGAHELELRFFPAWLNYGLYLCAAAVLLTVLLLVLCRRAGKRMSDGTAEACEPAPPRGEAEGEEAAPASDLPADLAEAAEPGESGDAAAKS